MATTALRIANPIEGASRFISRSRFESLQRQSLARLLSNGKVHIDSEWHRDHDIRRATNGLGGLARYDELRNTPVMMAPLLFTRHDRPKQESAQRARIVSELAMRLRANRTSGGGGQRKAAAV